MSKKIAQPKPTVKEAGAALSGTVHALEGGSYTVASSEGLPHRVDPAGGAAGPRCTCPNFIFNQSKEALYRCKHIWAVRFYLQKRANPHE